MRPLRKAVVVAALVPALAAAGCTASSGPTGPGTSSQSGASVSSGRTGGQGAVAASSAEVSFDADGTKTYGTLETPAHASGQRLAAALLIPGSGPTDRDGNQPAQGVTPDTLKLVAGILAKQGIATLRFDKYFTGKTGAGRFAEDPGSITIQDDLGQADAAYDFLSHQASVDPAKLLVVGHSEGGLFALNIAASDATKPAGLALLEPQDIRALDLIRIQTDELINALAAQGTLTVAQARSNGAAVVQAIGEFRAGQPVSTAGMAAPIAQVLGPTIVTPKQGAYLRSWDKVAPVDLASEVKGGTRVLVTDGSRDGKVPPSTIQPLAQALRTSGTTGPGLQLIEGTDHDMHLASQPATAAVLAPAIVTAITQWAQPFAA